MVNFRIFLAALGLLLPLGAQAPITWDVHVAMVAAEGDFKSAVGNKKGIEGDLSLTVPLSRRFALRPRLSHELFPVARNTYNYKSSRFTDRGEENEKWSAWSYGADALFRPWGEGGRFYLLAGAFVKAWKLQSYGFYSSQDRLNATHNYSVDDSSTSNEPAFTAGIGYSLHRHFSLEARANLATYRKLSYNTLECAAVYSF